MTGNGSGNPKDSRTARAAEEGAVDPEGSTAEADQGAADADQTASDEDQTASERDDADAANDQLASEQDQANADEHRPVDGDRAALDAYDADRLKREEGKVRRLATHLARAKTARQRAETAGERDATAEARDATAQRRDAHTQTIDPSVTPAEAALAEQLEQVRARAAADRARAAADRARAARDRAEAARERARLEAELRTAHLDDLTGALRREMGTLALNHEIDRARRGDGRFVLAFVDVDGMKRVNDQAGHAAGDQVLRTLVSTMRSNLCSFDPIVRYGGDEFMCGLSGWDIKQVERRFDQIGRTVKDEVGVGISVGLAALSAEETLDELTARADAELLDVKRGHEA